MDSSEGNVLCKGSEEASFPSQGDRAYESGTMLEEAGSGGGADVAMISM